ncbi:MAG: hypothetical protein R3F61_22780 [Myxococcota bacterium]
MCGFRVACVWVGLASLGCGGAVPTSEAGLAASAPPVLGLLGPDARFDGAGCTCDEPGGSVFKSNGDAHAMQIDGAPHDLSLTGREGLVSHYAGDGYTVDIAYTVVEESEGGTRYDGVLTVTRGSATLRAVLPCGCSN